MFSLVPPEFENKTHQNVYSFLGGEVNLTCQASGEPAPSYEWGYLEDGRFVEMLLSDVKIREDFADPPSSFISKNMTDKSQFRDIVCRARNALGSAERKFTVTEVGECPCCPPEALGIQRYSVGHWDPFSKSWQLE